MAQLTMITVQGIPMQYGISRNTGHPWYGGTGWDQLEVVGPSDDSINAFVQAAKDKYWVDWIIGHSDGQPSAVLFKPTGCSAPWSPCQPR